MPKNQLVVFGQTFTASEIDQESLMKAYDRVNPFSQKRAEGQEGAKPAVAEHDIAFEQMRPEFYKELTLVDVLSATAKVEQGAAGQRKDPHHLHEGKTTAGLLGQRLWVSGLVAGSVGHGEPRAIDHLNGVPPPETSAWDVGLPAIAHMSVELARRAKNQKHQKRQWSKALIRRIYTHI